MMRVQRDRQAEQGLQQALHVGGGEQIVSARYQANTLKRIVHYDRQMIGTGNVLARQHDITEQRGVDLNGTVLAGRSYPQFGKSERSSLCCRLGGIEAHHVRLGTSESAFALCRRQLAAGPRIDTMIGLMGRFGCTGDLCLDFAAGAEARIEQSQIPQLTERMAVGRETCRLTQHGPLPAQSQPGQVLFDRDFVLGPCAALVKVFNAQMKGTALRSLVGRDCGKSVSQMQKARRAWGKARVVHA